MIADVESVMAPSRDPVTSAFNAEAKKTTSESLSQASGAVLFISVHQRE
jgi:hypothetical protein